MYRGYAAFARCAEGAGIYTGRWTHERIVTVSVLRGVKRNHTI